MLRVHKAHTKSYKQSAVAIILKLLKMKIKLSKHITTHTRGLTEGNTQLVLLYPIGDFESPIGDILSNWGLVICSMILLYQTHVSPIPNWIYIIPDRAFEIPNWG